MNGLSGKRNAGENFSDRQRNRASEKPNREIVKQKPLRRGKLYKVIIRVQTRGSFD